MIFAIIIEILSIKVGGMKEALNCSSYSTVQRDRPFIGVHQRKKHIGAPLPLIILPSLRYLVEYLSNIR